MAPTEKPPSKIKGRVIEALGSVLGFQWSSFVQDEEYVPDLQWPTSLDTYDRLMSDPRIHGVMTALIDPILEWQFGIDRNGARPDVVEATAEDFGLPVIGDAEKPRRRMQGRFDHDEHLEMTLWQMMQYGHFWCEQVGDVEESERAWWRLRKLDPRPAKSLVEFVVPTDGSGGLLGIKQQGEPGKDSMIPITQLVGFLWKRKPGSWIGTSALRPMYKPFLLKDRASRVTAINIERAGGVPYATAPRGANDNVISKINALVQRFRVGDRSGATFPDGTKIDFAKGAGAAEGIAFIQLQNEEIDFAVQALFGSLGRGGNSGSRALGETFVNAFLTLQSRLAKKYAKTMNLHVIEDMVTWNVGPDEQAPLLTFTKGSINDNLGRLADMLSAGALTMDPSIEVAVRQALNLPSESGPKASDSSKTPPSADDDESEPAAAIAMAQRVLRPEIHAAGESRPPKGQVPRALNAAEKTAGIDFSAMDRQWKASRDALVLAWRSIRSEQIDQLRGQIAAADGDLHSLTRIRPEALGAELLAAGILQVLDEAAAGAIAEARSQGVMLIASDLRTMQLEVAVRAQAVADMLAFDLSIAASKYALALTDPALHPLSPLEVADAVGGDLSKLSDKYLVETFSGMLTAAQGAGRAAVMQHAPEGTKFHATEILDGNTCGPCRLIDETEYATLADALKDYPATGYRLCEGRFRYGCRGSVFAVYGDEAKSEMRGDEFDVAAAGKFTEKLHPRDHGKFSNKVGSLLRADIDEALGKMFTESETSKHRQRFADVDAIYTQAATDAPAFEEIVKGVEVPGARHLIAALKDRHTAEVKIAGRYDDNHNRLKDVVRGTIVVPTTADLPDAMAAVRARAEAAGWTVLDAEQRFTDPPSGEGATADGYRDVSMALVSPGGLATELQLSTEAMVAAKDGEGHRLYELIRSIERSAGKEGRVLTADELERTTAWRVLSRQVYLEAYEASYPS